MIVIQGNLVSEDIFKEQFVCDLNACKGKCCVDGESGAPLSESEAATITEIYPAIKDSLSLEGRKEIEENAGFYIDVENGIPRTSMLKDGTCVYAVTKGGVVQCGIEHAHKEGKTDFVKPISCHMYPVRVLERGVLTAVNYDVWEICSDACVLGEHLKVPAFRFVKNALVRKFGDEFYDECEEVYTELQEEE